MKKIIYRAHCRGHPVFASVSQEVAAETITIDTMIGTNTKSANSEGQII